MELEYRIKIPKERIAVLIGTKGEVKKLLEEETRTKLIVDSKEGDVLIKGEDALDLYATREIIKAIGRGFNPEIAKLLLKQDYCFEMINLKDSVRPTQIPRIKGRIIGKDGRTREVLEEQTETNVSVYGKTISIIGRVDAVSFCRRAIVMLIRGSQHASVYRWLERMRATNKIGSSSEDITPFLRDTDEKKDRKEEETSEED